MIRWPAIGRKVQVHYGKGIRRHPASFPLHGKAGTIVGTTRGPGPRSVAIEVAGTIVIIPRGNLRYC